MLPSPEDHVAICDLLARYCLTLDYDDVEGWVALFTPAASYEVYGRSFDGHDGLRQMMGVAPGGLHLGGPPVIEMVDADHATTRRNLLFVERDEWRRPQRRLRRRARADERGLAHRACARALHRRRGSQRPPGRVIDGRLL